MKQWQDFYAHQIEKTYENRSKQEYFTRCSVLDTETSYDVINDNYVGWVYQWAFDYFDPTTQMYEVITGRTPSQLMSCLKQIKAVNRPTKKNPYIIYVHNLSYDYQYLKGYLRQVFDRTTEDTIAISAHELISYYIDGFLFKCSYRLSNQSLDQWSNNLQTQHRKLVGYVDYTAKHYQDSMLTAQDNLYMKHDILVLRECLESQLQMYSDTLQTAPLTSTGYVRRDCFRAFARDKHNKENFKNSKLCTESYNLCRLEFAGGITHGNRHYANQTVQGTIRHRDFASHYPSQQICYLAPIGEFTKASTTHSICKKICQENSKHLDTGLAYLAKLELHTARLRNPDITLPYLQSCKIEEAADTTTNLFCDNGRVLDFSGVATIVVNEYDYAILRRQYKMTGIFKEVWTAKKGAYPKFLTDTVMYYFKQKTLYKDKVKQLKKQGVTGNELANAERELLRFKGLLNGIYGMSATNPVRESFIEVTTENIAELVEKYPDINYGAWIKKPVDDDVELAKFYEKYKSFMSYQLGVWTTSTARYELIEFVELIGYKNFLYADTDSIFYLSTPQIEKKIERQNKKFRKECDKNGWYYEHNGIKTYFNQFEDEAENITDFKFLHAKCYAYVVDSEELNATIAGVPKRTLTKEKDYVTRTDELGTIDNLKNGFMFYTNGGTCSKYTELQPQTTMINGHVTEISSSCCIVKTEKTLKETIEDTVIFWGKE